jgi:hypothetical protein
MHETRVPAACIVLKRGSGLQDASRYPRVAALPSHSVWPLTAPSARRPPAFIPQRYIFESNMVQLLLGLFPQAPFRNVALQCLTEVRAPRIGRRRAPGCRAAPLGAPSSRPTTARPCAAPLPPYPPQTTPQTQVASLAMDESFDDRFQQFFKIFSQQLFQILPPGARAPRPPAPPSPAFSLRPCAAPIRESSPRPRYLCARALHGADLLLLAPPTHDAPPGTNIEAAYASGTDEQQAFVQNLALFYTSFFRVGRVGVLCVRVGGGEVFGGVRGGSWGDREAASGRPPIDAGRRASAFARSPLSAPALRCL